ncbi:cell envelope biogenesis protein OmpA [Streptomyces sp. NPDC102441]|uniref:cell envelope biogenesis protein OmpA n=1 Tax=Streptomyces sp. NPDC102441 TaxID=3366176 RepID=UPI0037F928E3
MFGSLDPHRVRRAFLERLCQTCGQPLEERCFLIVRPADVERGYAPEPALHPECQPYTASSCPMLNGTATQYRERPALAGHPAGRRCSDPDCPCPSLAPDSGHAARSGRPADQYEAWMISTARYEVVRSDAVEPMGIRLDVPVLRMRLLREAALPREAVRFLAALRELDL